MNPSLNWWDALLPFRESFGDLAVFNHWISLTSAALSAPHQEAEYEAVVNRFADHGVPPETVTETFARAFGMLVLATRLNPGDQLGPLLRELTGAEPLPGELAEIMARINLDLPGSPGDAPFTLVDPACSTGAAILAADRVARERGYTGLHADAWTDDASEARITHINLALHGIPGSVTLGDPTVPIQGERPVLRTANAVAAHINALADQFAQAVGALK